MIEFGPGKLYIVDEETGETTFVSDTTGGTIQTRKEVEMENKKQIKIKLLDEASRVKVEEVIKAKNEAYMSLRIEKQNDTNWVLDCSTLYAHSIDMQLKDLLKKMADLDVGIYQDNGV